MNREKKEEKINRFLKLVTILRVETVIKIYMLKNNNNEIII